MVLAELRAVAFVKNEHHALVAQRFQLFLVGGLALLLVFLVALAVFIQGQAELLDGGDNHLVRVVVGEEPSHQRAGVGVFLDAACLKSVEFLPRLPVEVFAVHDKDAFFDDGVVFEKGGGLEGG